MVALNVALITLGQVIAYGIDAAFENTNGGWRWMVGLGAVPSGLQFFFLFYLPESRKVLSVRLHTYFADSSNSAHSSSSGTIR